MHTRQPPPDELPDDTRKAIRTWFEKTYPRAKINMQEHWEDCRDYYLMQGESGNQLNWGACFRRWLRRGQTPKHPYQEARRGSAERPQQSRESFAATDLANLKGVLKGGDDD